MRLTIILWPILHSPKSYQFLPPCFQIMSKFGDHFHEMQNDLESLKDRELEQKAVKSARNGGQHFLRRSMIDTLKINNGKGKPWRIKQGIEANNCWEGNKEIQCEKGRPQCTKRWSQQVLRQALSSRRSALTLDRCPSGRSVVQDQSCQNHQHHHHHHHHHQEDLLCKIKVVKIINRWIWGGRSQNHHIWCSWFTWARRTRHFSSCCLMGV